MFQNGPVDYLKYVRDNMFSELRMGTLVQQSGYILNEINNEKSLEVPF